ncbi:iron-sulfur cluster assembly scaffold protein [Sphingomonas astaxanthinifaciens]|uniref:Iron-sulfur cluster scaffold-like protein n=1 Tax=Sphingomonas astaxanthinifaciens DSM 22298 TaxID=1123267 RepID=A0ABQ5Z9A6_9SPHN|nr:iron-sulfur cluster assembly scaffold protein [Sphingomonas astaxanthinifaciens]GLR48061.1 iron-sulfur cluster scaffold-like protein [Sphingomonas astaxanthinifaciens DSM 22298]
MTREPPYTLEILRLAASLPLETGLEGADGTGEARSPTCGSRMTTMVRTEDGRIAAIAQSVTACAYGQASAALLQRWAPGRLTAEVIVMRAAVKAWLEGRGELPQGYEALRPVQERSGRHGAVLLPFDALLAALKEKA